MHGKTVSGIALGTLICVPLSSAFAADLKVSVGSLASGSALPVKYAMCQPAAQGHAGPGGDISPPMSWSTGPSGTKSYAIILTDTDSPKTDRDKMNKEGMTVPKTAERQSFYHWVLVDIPANVTSLEEGADSSGRVEHGKTTPSKAGMHGINMFTMVFAANDAMKGKYVGYDGPCPAWNDENLHHLHFTVYALGVDKLGLPVDFDGPAAIEAMKGKILAEGKLDATYTTNPATGAIVPKQ
jgi:Raf kinase inhibitor-like YbhB/YbcL family protein